MDGWSLEATLPKTGEIENLVTLLAPGTEIYLSTLPHLSLDQQIETAKLVRASGFEPVLHVAVRYFSARTELVGFLARANREVGADRVLVVAGDVNVPHGEFGSSLTLIESGLLQDYGIRRIGIAGYPEGHPKISTKDLNQALDDKLHAAKSDGLDIHVVTQFCLDALPIIHWLDDFQSRWPSINIKIGLAGPCSAVTLLKLAIRCGINTPVNGFSRKLSTAFRLVRSVTPRDIIKDLDNYYASRGDAMNVSTHFYSFGGLEKTARWAAEESGASLSPVGDIRSTVL